MSRCSCKEKACPNSKSPSSRSSRRCAQATIMPMAGSNSCSRCFSSTSAIPSNRKSTETTTKRRKPTSENSSANTSPSRCKTTALLVIRPGPRCERPPDEAVGTDGRKPHTFVEKGPEARWVCEQTNFEIKIDSDKDTVTMSLASVGTEPVDKFQATIFVTPQGGKKTQLPPITIGPATSKRETGSGDIHQVVLSGFAAKFGAGTHVIQGFLPQELGGDKFEDKVVINKSAPTGAVVVTVTNKATGRPIENATVDINGAKDQTTKTGLVNIDGIRAGNRPFKVTANGFQDESGTVDVPGDENAPAAILKVALKPAQ